MKGDTEINDFLCEQASLYDQSRSCIWCHQIFQCIDSTCATQEHPYCSVKDDWHAEEPQFDPTDMM